MKNESKKFIEFLNTRGLVGTLNLYQKKDPEIIPLLESLIAQNIMEYFESLPEHELIYLQKNIKDFEEYVIAEIVNESV